MIVLTKHQIEMQTFAKEIYDWCKKKHLWSDIIIYFNGKAWKSDEDWSGVKGKKIGEDLYEFEDRNPCDYFEYGNPNTLSMSFEGPLYDVLNGYCYGWTRLEDEFLKLFEKHGYYYELGYAWSLSAYEI